MLHELILICNDSSWSENRQASQFQVHNSNQRLPGWIHALNSQTQFDLIYTQTPYV